MVTFDDITALRHKNLRLSKVLDKLRRAKNEVIEQNVLLQELATIDPLTKCLNRRAFFEIFDKQWSAAERYKQNLGVIMVDVDFFKVVNDSHGHAVGDDVIEGIAKILLTCTRGPDHVCRYGGEEFCVLIQDGGPEKATEAAERFRAAIAAHSIAGINITASFGVSSLELGAENPLELIHHADQALYAAKHAGRNRVVHWGSMSESDHPDNKTS